MLRDIIRIDEELCTGCGLCVPNCHEGALQIIDGKVRLISELMCDGLGACIGHCPEGAITIEKREAEPYSEKKVLEQMINKGKNTVIAHMKHLKEHGEKEYLREAVEFLRENRARLDFNPDEVLHEIHNHRAEALSGSETNLHAHSHNKSGGCPGAREMMIERAEISETREESYNSELRHWPVQLHLINPSTPAFRGADLLVAADCTAFSTGGFHSRFLKGKSLVIACPKLDQGLDIYLEKIRILIEVAKVNTITVMVMEVPCCSGLLQIVKKAIENSSRKVPVKLIVIGINGSIKKEEWV
ncbi:MAG TPA: 4Fe-4S binding protein [Bacteroidales bacterium]|nr:4Fe-4S binding protein [Bacteroidales bacterium]